MLLESLLPWRSTESEGTLKRHRCADREPAVSALGGRECGSDYAAAQLPDFGLKTVFLPCIHAVSPD
jgi:hypothetical protein